MYIIILLSKLEPSYLQNDVINFKIVIFYKILFVMYVCNQNDFSKEKIYPDTTILLR